MAETRTLSQFKSKLIGGGTRPNLFEVSIPTFPTAISEAWAAGDDSENGIFKFLCKATSLPASNLGSIEIPFRGRTLKVAGDRTVDTWTVTVINDENFGLRYAFEAWVEHMARLSNNIGATLPAAYMTNATVYQLGRGKEPSSQDNTGGSNAILAQYNFIDIFPTNVSQIDLSYDNGDQIEEFTVEFQVNSWNRGTLAEPEEEDE